MSARKFVFSLAVGIVYLVFGITQILLGIFPGFATALSPSFIPTDIIQGLVLCVISAVFLYGAAEIRVRRPGAEAFLYVGMLISLTFCTITLLDLGAQGINTIFFGNEDGSHSWPLTQFIVPIIYLGIPSLAGFCLWGRKFLADLTEV